MKRLALVFFLLAAPLEAQTLPYWIASAGQAADLVTTLRFSHNGSACTEGNAFFANPEGNLKTGKAISFKLVMIAGVWGLRSMARTRRGTLLGKMAMAGAYSMGAVGFYDSIHNIRQCGF